MAEKNQKLVLSILEFLQQSIANGTIREDDSEGIEVAIQCIGEAFGVDPSNEDQRKKLSIKPATLSNVFDVYLKTLDKVNQTSQPAASTSAPPKASTSKAEPTSADKATAEQHKLKGNQLMGQRDFAGAIAEYSHAIALDPTSAVFYSNRAAAQSSSNNHPAAIKDAEEAIKVDPKFVKAYHRLGHAHYCLENYEDAEKAFEDGLAYEPNNANLKAGRDNARAQIQVSTPTTAPAASSRAGGAGGMPDMSELLRSLGGGAGGAGAGGPGGFDIASMLQNPDLMRMAQQLMGNGGMEGLMRNPALSNMMDRVNSGNMPSMDELMSDPALRQMAQGLGGGLGGLGGAGAGAGGTPPRPPGST